MPDWNPPPRPRIGDPEKLAQAVGHSLSEILNDEAPIGEALYIAAARVVLTSFNLVEKR